MEITTTGAGGEVKGIIIMDSVKEIRGQKWKEMHTSSQKYDAETGEGTRMQIQRLRREFHADGVVQVPLQVCISASREQYLCYQSQILLSTTTDSNLQSI